MSGTPPPPGGRTTSPEAQLVAGGLAPDRAIPRLREAGLWDDDGPTGRALELLGVLSEAASPEDALHVVTGLARRHPEHFDALVEDEAWCRRFVLVGGASRPLGDLLAQHPDALSALRHPEPVEADRIAAEVAEALRATPDGPDRPAAVARIRRATTASIAARDLTGAADVAQVGRDLAHLAAGVLAGTLEVLHGEVGGDDPAARLCVIGMGKLGGEELNYVSDVDVVFVHDPLDGHDDDEARAESQKVCGSLLQVLNASTTMGRAYEVDPTLRPEGRDGPLSRTVGSFVAYWERWAETWEFQALLKAHPVAGDLALGEQLLAEADRFVWPERLDPDVVSEIREMKGRVEAKAEVLRHGARQLKLGPGGLRDIEFAVQLLQLVHGRSDRALRVGGTLDALAALARGGYVAEEDAETFAGAYRLLRDVEHRLQLAQERRTHTLPDDPDLLERLARSLGYTPAGDLAARDPFLGELRRVQGEVRDLHAKLFYRPLLEAHARVPAADAALVATEEERPTLDEEAARTRIEALGFRDATGVLRDVRSLTGGVTRRAATLRGVLPIMLHALSDSPDPDGGVRAFRTLVESLPDDSSLTATLRDQPPAAELLARLLGTSEVVGQLLAGQPQGIEWITDPDARSAPRRPADLTKVALGMLTWQDGLEAGQAALRRFKRRELVRIVVRDLAGDAGVSVVGAELAALGAACLEGGLRAVLEARDEDEPPARIAIVGLGKLGGSELHYVSDLDVVFVHEPVAGGDDRDASRFAIAVAEQVLRTLSGVTAEGTAFEVDPELRPEGKNGPLSRSLSSCRTYYERWAEPWEHQALLKAEHVAGDADVGRAFVDLARRHAYPGDFEERRATATRRMKARIERERVPRRADPARHLKLGPGGLSDIEWTVQLLQQQHGHRDAMVRTTSTMGALDALQDAGIVDHRDVAWLRDGYRFLSQIRNRLYLLRQRDVDSLPSSGPTLEKLARSLGYGRGGRQDFEDDYLRHTRHVRQVTQRLFYGVEG